MQAESENWLLSRTVQRRIIILLLGAVMMATMNMGKSVYASERMISTEEDLANGFETGPPTILSFVKQPIELEEGQVFNQSGRSYSGVVNSSPLGEEIEMTAYGQWPDGFTKPVQAFSGAVYDGEYIWMVPYRADLLIRFHPETGQMDEYAAWPAGFDPGPDHFANGAFFGGVFDGKSIWLIPSDANMVVQFNPETGEMRGYDDWPDGITANYKFSGGYYDGESIILIPHSSGALVELNPATGKMTGYRNWPDGLQWGANGLAFASSVFDGENLWMLPYEANQIVKFNTLTKEMQGYDEAPAGVNLNSPSFIGGAYDGERIWMAPLTTDYMLAINATTGQMSKYEIWPAGEQPIPSSYNSMFYDGEAVWLIPYNQNAFMRVDPNTGEATLHGNWPEEFNKDLSSFFASVSDGEHLWAIPFSADQVVRVSKKPVNTYYAVTYDGNGASDGVAPIDLELYQEGQTVTVLGNTGQLSLPGYRFAGWSLSANSTEADYVEGDTFTMGTSDTVLYAVWAEIPVEPPETYTLRYDANGATSGNVPVGEQRYNNGDLIPVEPNSGRLQKEGCSFAGWNTKPDGSGTTYASGDPLTIEGADVILYALWIPIERPIPSAPENLKAMLGDGEVTLTWSEIGGAVYSVYRYEGNKAPEDQKDWQIVAERISAATFAVSGLTNGVDYTFAVTAFIDEVESDFSMTITAKPQAPSNPADNEAPQWQEGSELTVSDVGQTSVKLSWPSATDNIGVAEYRIYVDNEEVQTVMGSVYGYTVTDLTAETTYTFIVRAFDESGNQSLPLSKQATTATSSGGGNGGGSGSGRGQSLSNNADLADLQVWLGDKKLQLNPTFASGTTDYTLLTEAEYVEIAAKPAHFAARVIWKDTVLKERTKVHLEEGDNKLVMIVRAENGSEKKYTLNIRRVTPEPSEPVTYFTDIAGHWAESYISRATAKGMVSGYPDGTFKPNLSVTRAEFAVMLAGALQLEGTEATLSFTDIEQFGTWAEQAVARAVHAGIVEGYEDGSFRPNAQITRAEMAVMIVRGLNLPIKSNTFTGFADDEVIPQWAKDYVEALRGLDIARGREGNQFVPNDSTTRAEAVTIMLRMLDILL